MNLLVLRLRCVHRSYLLLLVWCWLQERIPRIPQGRCLQHARLFLIELCHHYGTCAIAISFRIGDIDAVDQELLQVLLWVLIVYQLKVSHKLI